MNTDSSVGMLRIDAVASDVMVKQVIKLKTEDCVREALLRFALYRVSGLPIVNDRNEVVGLISERILMQRIGRDELKIIPLFYSDFLPMTMAIVYDEERWNDKLHMIMERNVMELADRHAPIVQMNAKIDEIAALLGKRHVSKVIVAENNVLAGIISRGDMVRFVSASLL